MIIEARDDVVTLEGSLVTNQWSAIQAPANLLLRFHPNGILIDAGGITRCTEDGARTFLDAMDYIERHRAQNRRLPPTAGRCRRRSRIFRICAPSSPSPPPARKAARRWKWPPRCAAGTRSERPRRRLRAPC